MNYYVIFEKLFGFFTPIWIFAFLLNVWIKREKIGCIDKTIEENSEEKIEVEQKWKRTMRNVLVTLTILSIGVLCFVVVINKALAIILFPCSLLYYLEQFNKASYDVEVVQNAFKQSAAEPLSLAEWNSLVGIAAFLCFVNLYKIPSKIIIQIQNIEKDELSDFILIVFLILISTIYIFVIGIVFFSLIKNMILLFESLFKKRKWKRGKRIYNYMVDESKKSVFKEYKCILFCERMKHNKSIIVIAIIPIIILDVLQKMFYVLYRLVLSCIINLIIFLKRTMMLLKNISKKIGETSDRCIAIIFFRISFVLSVMSLVVYNRYYPLLKEYVNGTASLEFVSSAIVIPILFSWIIDLKNNKITT